MKKYGLICMMMLSACSSVPNKESRYVEAIDQPNSQPTCTFPNSDEAAPNWICDMDAGKEQYGFALGAVGIFEHATGAINLARQIAKLRARVSILRQLNVANDSGTVIGARQYWRVYDSQGTLYLLMGLDEEGLQSTKRVNGIL